MERRGGGGGLFTFGVREPYDMNSIGEFHKGEIDGKPFHIFTSLSQTDTQQISSSPLFLCPFARIQLRLEKEFQSNIQPLNTSPHFPSHLPPDCNVICKLPVVPIFWCNNKELDFTKAVSCGADYYHCLPSKIGTDYYICRSCKTMYNKEYVESPLEIKHPSYPLLSLQLYAANRPESCICCESKIVSMVYHCPTNNLIMHPVCAMKPVPILIDHPKRHPHPLTFFPKQAYLPCDVCGLIKESVPTYACLECIFTVHQDCIYFPYVIKISRHNHRISFTYSLPSGEWSCGVCRKPVDNHCGAYSCNKCTNGYFVHTRCALRKDLWDGKELEGVPEETEIIVEPFEIIADGVIHHFTHDAHHLKHEVISRVYDDDKFCQACILPIYEGNYYSCMDRCDFLLHETCAYAPRKKHHALHALPLTLKVVPDKREYSANFFECDACGRLSCGFVYEAGSYRLDLRCASVSEPFDYQGHDHPLFLALDRKQELEAPCHICQEKKSYLRKLNCIECNFVICFMCATLPYKAKYKHDNHFLTFREGKDGSDQFDWCEVCEKKIVYSSKEGFYACEDCCTTLHVRCLLLGEDLYLRKPGQALKLTVWINSKYEVKEIHILPNSTVSRPFCHRHNEDRCPHKVVFKSSGKTFCSYLCLAKEFSS